MDCYHHFFRVIILGLSIAVIQSCGSSDSSSVIDDQGTPFNDPVDAQTLRSALATGVSPADIA